MAADETKGKFPFTPDGSLLSYFDGYGGVLAGDAYYRGEVVWRDRFQFEETLLYDGYHKGRSSAVILLKTYRGAVYPVSIRDFDGLIRAGRVQGTLVEADWGFKKVGQNYFLTPLDVE